MSNDPKQTLQYIISTYGMAVIDDKRRLKGLLMDLCGNHPREVKLLSLALAEGAVHKLLSYKTLPIEAAIRLSAKVLEDSVGMSKEAALWAIEIWAEACIPPEIPHEFTNSLQMKFVLIPAGTFMMGGTSVKFFPGGIDEDTYAKAKPHFEAAFEHFRKVGKGLQEFIGTIAKQFGDEIRPYLKQFLLEKKYRNTTTLHQVTISKPFYLQTTPVTQGKWQEVMGNNPSRFKGDDNLPVENVSWNQVQDFIGRLNRQEGSDKYRLPTETEWEYACRTGSTTAYSFGDDPGSLGEHTWYGDNSEGKTQPVGQKKPNAWGLYDMHGNVCEWCQDWLEYYPTGHVTDPEGPSLGSGRVDRGGSWRSSARDCRSADRDSFAPGSRDACLGFRLLMKVAVSGSPSTDKSTSASNATETGRDGRFIAYGNGTVLDTKTNLMWAAEDNGNNINWVDAKSYCENYRGGGYTDWRMPTQDELAGLYDAGKSQCVESGSFSATNHVATDSIILTSLLAWASKTSGPEAALLSFTHGLRLWFPQSLDFNLRALPVRSGK